MNRINRKKKRKRNKDKNQIYYLEGLIIQKMK